MSRLYPPSMMAMILKAEETLEEVFGGKLMEELRRSGRGLRYPFPELDPISECVDQAEDTTNEIMIRWTKPMVRMALKAVENVFSHVLWVAKSRTKTAASRATTSEPEEKPSRVPLKRKVKPINIPRSTRAKSKPNPDGGGIFVNSRKSESKAIDDPNPYEKQDNRLPCEIKPGCKWTSYKLLNGELVDESGDWRGKMFASRDAAPLLQIYNYCVKCQARYGFLITSKEVLAVRVRPIDVLLNRSYQDLIDKLYYYGVMEYKVIPWENHSSGDDYREMIINLAVWFLCILAGNDHSLQWQYGPLANETISKNKKQPNDLSESTQPLTQVSNIDTEDFDPVQSSFTTQGTESTGIHRSFTVDSDGIGSQIPRRGRKRGRPPQLPKKESAKRRRANRV